MGQIRSSMQLVDEANTQVEQVDPADVISAENDTYILVDIRDVRELEREGMIADAVQAPRGMLEFWVDPANKYHREVFAQEDKIYVLYCAMAWRSALAAKSLQDMGMSNVKHLSGGFAAWKEAGGPVVERPSRKK